MRRPPLPPRFYHRGRPVATGLEYSGEEMMMHKKFFFKTIGPVPVGGGGVLGGRRAGRRTARVPAQRVWQAVCGC